MKNSPLVVKVQNQKHPEQLLGSATIPWAQEYLKMVERCADEPAEPVAPVSSQETYTLKNGITGDKLGSIKLFLRISCFGRSIQTRFQIMDGTEDEKRLPKQFLFKSNSAETTFQAQRYVTYMFISKVILTCKLIWTLPVELSEQQ